MLAFRMGDAIQGLWPLKVRALGVLNFRALEVSLSVSLGFGF